MSFVCQETFSDNFYSPIPVKIIGIPASASEISLLACLTASLYVVRLSLAPIISPVTAVQHLIIIVIIILLIFITFPAIISGLVPAHAPSDRKKTIRS